MLLGVFLASVVAVVLYAVFGALGDKWGRKTTYLLGAVLMLLSIAPAFALINTGSALNFTLAIILVFGIAMAPAGGVPGRCSAWCSPPRSATPAPRSATRSRRSSARLRAPHRDRPLRQYGSSVPVVVYLLVVAAISVVSVLLLPGKLGKPENAGVVTHDSVTRDSVTSAATPGARQRAPGALDHWS